MQGSHQSGDTDAAALTLFELGAGGHFPFYMRLILEAWPTHGTGCVRAIITSRFLKQHPSVFEGFDKSPGASIRWVTLDDADEAALYAFRASAEAAAQVTPSQAKSVQNDDGQESVRSFYWNLLEKYGRKFPSRHILLMNLDEYVFAISSGRQAPADFSGIFFRPDFYYGLEVGAPLRRRVFHAFQEQLVLRMLNHPQLRVAFFIDPWVAESLQGKGTARVVSLYEPVRVPALLSSVSERAEIRSRLGVPADRKLFLLAGAISGRKGIWRLLESIGKLTPQDAARICVAIVGRSDESLEARLTPHFEELAKSIPIAIIRMNAYVDDVELEEWFVATDAVLAPYIHHVGMSGILLLAAAHRKPVISTKLGAMGKLTREYRLGVTVDSRSADELVQAMRRFITNDPLPEWEPDNAYSFADDRSHDKFGGRLLDVLRPFWTS